MEILASEIVAALVRATPLLITGLAVALAFRAGIWNIGAEGQFYAGAVAAAWIGTRWSPHSPLVALPLVMLVAGLHPLWIVATAIFFGALEAGAATLQRTAGVPSVTVYAIEGAIILVLVAGSRRVRRAVA